MINLLFFENLNYSLYSDFLKPASKLFKKNNNVNSLILNSFLGDKQLFFKKSKRVTWDATLWYYKHVWGVPAQVTQKRMVAYFILQDMLNMHVAWRRWRGYPVHGQRTRSNSKSAKQNNKLMYAYRLRQFTQTFGTKKRINYSTLISAEYMNKFWLRFRVGEWLQAKGNLWKFLHKKTKKLEIDLVSLSKGITSGYKRTGYASRLNKSKKQLKSATIGLPLFFSKHMYGGFYSKKFPYQLSVQQELKRVVRGAKWKKKKTIKKKVKKKNRIRLRASLRHL